MSSFTRRIQKKLMKKAGVEKVPVRNGAGKTLGFRYPLVVGHKGYANTGAAL